MVKALFRLIFYFIIAVSLFVGYQMYRNQEFPWLKERVETATTRGAIQAALAVNRHLSSRPIEVQVSLEQVTLVGTVRTKEESASAEEIASAVPGVEEIDNRLLIDPDLPEVSDESSRTLGQRLDDATLHAKILGALRLDRELSEIDLELAVRQGDVELTVRAAPRGQLNRLTRRIEDIDGVRSVTTRSSPPQSLPSLGPTASEIERTLRDHEHLGKYRLGVSLPSDDEPLDRLTLQGRVETEAERELAELIASRLLDQLLEQAGSDDLELVNEISVGGK